MASVAFARVQSADQEHAKVAGANNFHGAPRGTFAAADGHYNIGVNRDDFWVRLCQAMGRPELRYDSRYASYIDRAKRHKEVEGILEGWSRQLPREQMIDAITAADVPVPPVLTMEEVLELEYFGGRRSVVEVDEAIGGVMRQPNDPTGFAITDAARVPHLDEHRLEILRGLGNDEDQILAIIEAGASDNTLATGERVGSTSHPVTSHTP